MARSPHGPLGFKTYKHDVVLRPGESVHFLPGFGYYAARAANPRNGLGYSPIPQSSLIADYPNGPGGGALLPPAPVQHPILNNILTHLLSGQGQPFLGHGILG